MGPTEEQPEVHWTDALEQMVKRQAEEALALRWSHDESARLCATYQTYLIIPSTILSLISGAGQVGADKMFPFDGAVTLLGCISLLTGILQMLTTYFKFSTRAESHRISSLAYGKIHAHLSLQLSIPRHERQKPQDVIDFIKFEGDRLSEIAPQIPLKIKMIFHDKFNDMPTAKPVILNGLSEVFVVAPIQKADTPLKSNVSVRFAEV